jgi:hypothetical protein
MTSDCGYFACWTFGLSCSSEMSNSTIRHRNRLGRAKCAQGNLIFYGIFETQLNITGKHTCLVVGCVKCRSGEKVGVKDQVWDEVVGKLMKRGKECRKRNV